MLNRLFAALCVVFVFYSTLFAQSGVPDPTFGRNGRVTTNLLPSDDQGFALQIRPDGRILVAGRATVASVNQFAVLQFLPDGKPDESFNYDGRFIPTTTGPEEIAYSAALAPDGSATVAGFAGDEGFEDFKIMRLTSGGMPDSSFAGTGGLTLDFDAGQDFSYVALHQSDNKTVLAGYTSPDGFESNFALARLMPDGQPDPDFGDNGKVVQSFSTVSDLILDAELQPDGKIVVAGQVYNEDFSSDFIVGRYTPDGQLDSTFGTNGIAIINLGDDDLARGVALQPDGKIVVAGIAVTDLQPRIGVARLLANGHIDTGFGDNGQLLLEAGPLGSFCTDVLVQSNGNILLAGMVENGDFRDFFLLRRLQDGSPDLAFGDNGLAVRSVSPTNDNAYRLALQPDGKILLVGVSETGAFSDFTLLRYAADGKPDPGFGKNGVVLTDVGSSDDPLLAITLQADGKIVGAGQALQAGDGYLGLVRYKTNGSPDSTFNNNGIFTAHPGNASLVNDVQVQADGKIVGAGTMNGIAGLIRLTAAGLPDGNFGTAGIAGSSFAQSSAFYTLAIRPDGKILAGGRSPLPNEQDLLVQYLPNGNYDLGFGTNGQAQAPAGILRWSRLNVLPDGKFFALGTRFLNGLIKGTLVKFQSTGAVDPAFGNNGQVIDGGFSVPGINLEDFVVLPNGKILVAGGQGNFEVAQLLSDGSADAGFGLNGSASYSYPPFVNVPARLAVQADGRILIAGMSFDTVNSGLFTGFTVLRLEPDGTPDSTFGVNGFVSLPGIRASAITVQPDGAIVAAGTAFNGHDSDFLLFRLLDLPNVGVLDRPEAGLAMVNLYPNPVSTSLRIEYELPENQRVSIRCFDARGHLLTIFLNGENRPSGSNQELLHFPPEWPSGYYTLVVETAIGSKTLRVIKQ